MEVTFKTTTTTFKKIALIPNDCLKKGNRICRITSNMKLFEISKLTDGYIIDLLDFIPSWVEESEFCDLEEFNQVLKDAKDFLDFNNLIKDM